MNPNLSTLIRFGLDVVVKATLLLGLTAAALFLLKRASASVRQLVASFGLAGALLLPAASLLAPRWEIPLLRNPVPEVAPPAEALATWTPRAETKAPAAPARRDVAEADLGVTGPISERASEGTGEVPVRKEFEPAGSAPRASSSPAGWMLATLALWLAGALLSAARTALGAARVAGIRRRASSEADGAWTSSCVELAAKLGLSRPVRLLFSGEIAVPVTVGLQRPVILLPEAARRWNAERRQVVLLHELAHVRRGDWAALLVGQAASAVYWFHPLAWSTRIQMQKDCERACDDLVLAAGTRASVYAAHLLSIIRSLRLSGQRALPAVAMAHRSYWDGRMRAILDPAVVRRVVSGRQARIAAIAIFAAVAALAVFEPWTPRAEAMASDRMAGHVDVASVTAQRGSPSTPCEKSARKEAPVAPAGPGSAVERKPGKLASFFTGVPSAVAGDPETAQVLAEAASAMAGEVSSGLVHAGWKNPKGGGDWYSRGMNLHNSERYDEAIEAFRHAIDEGTRVDAATYNIACGYALKGDARQAVEWLRKSLDEGFELSSYIDKDDDLDGIRSDPGFVELRRNLRAEERNAEKHRGDRLARKLSELEGSRSTRGGAFYRLGKELLEAGNYGAAAQAFQASAARGNREGASLYNTACALSLAGDRARALDFLEKSLAAGFDDVGLFRRDDDLDNVRGEPRYRELLQMAQDLELHRFGDEMNARSWTRAGRRNAWRETEQHFGEYVQRHPRSGRAWYNLGYARIEGERPEAAVEAFRRALDLQYRPGASMYNLACAYSLLDRKDEAFGWLFRALDAGFDGEGTLRGDDDLDNLRGDPRFRQALARVKTVDGDGND
jgi:beta-lactamase regulating signal transducer with metallopeptidase domain/tetratricopeptide (TPR) repeat protein